MTSAGRLRTEVVLQRPSDEQPVEAEGDLVRSWVTVDTVWADIRAISGREFFQGQQVESTISHRVAIRYRDDVTSDWRLQPVHAPERTLNVNGPPRDLDGRRRTLELFCTEVEVHA